MKGWYNASLKIFYRSKISDAEMGIHLVHYNERTNAWARRVGEAR
jgi:hypothetical protein